MPDEKTQPDSPSPAAPPTGSMALPPPDPERLKEVLRRRDVILASGQAPELLFVGRMNGADLMYAHEKKPVVLLFTAPHAALDYIRVNKTACEVGQLKFDMLPAAALEMIRDHINCSVPYVYEFIAFLARLDNDEEAKAAAIERLKEFGPRFADFDARWTMPDLAKSLATAMVGLLVNFGIPLPNSLGQTAAPAS